MDESFCAYCGHIINRMTVGAKISGMFMTGDERIGVCEIIMCSECWEKVMVNVKKGMAGARQLSEELKRIDEDFVGK